MNDLRVLMIPTLERFKGEESGIKRVIEAYHKYAPGHGIRFVDCPVDAEDSYDVFALHAGTSTVYPKKKPVVAILHGLYWTADYDASNYEWKANANVIESVRRANSITVPSHWVAESITRDVRRLPHIIPHGIEWQEWLHSLQPEDYVLWNKNRVGDVCSPEAVSILARRFTGMKFVTTYSDEQLTNVKEIGLQPHGIMKNIIQRAAVYLATTKETFGIGILEAMAAGVPVLGFAHGGITDTVEHGVTGYLAQPGNYDDLAQGLQYCVKNRTILGQNAMLDVKKWSWSAAVEKLCGVFRFTYQTHVGYQRPIKIDQGLYLS